MTVGRAAGPFVIDPRYPRVEVEAAVQELGLSDIAVHTPWRIQWGPRKLKRSAAKQLAHRIKVALDANPGKQLIESEGFRISRIPGLGFISFGSHSSAHWVNEERFAGSILDTLADKDAQVALPRCRRIIIAIEMETSLRSYRREVRDYFLDMSPYPGALH